MLELREKEPPSSGVDASYGPRPRIQIRTAPLPPRVPKKVMASVGRRMAMASMLYGSIRPASPTEIGTPFRSTRAQPGRPVRKNVTHSPAAPAPEGQLEEAAS